MNTSRLLTGPRDAGHQYRQHCFSIEVVEQRIWLYFRFDLSYRNVGHRFGPDWVYQITPYKIERVPEAECSILSMIWCQRQHDAFDALA
jgi:hypothetical protein